MRDREVFLVAGPGIPSSRRPLAQCFPRTLCRPTGPTLGIRTFGSLDGIRGLCILAVLSRHHSGPENQVNFSKRGFLGVDMFFVLSGFLIVTLLLREATARGGSTWKKFMRVGRSGSSPSTTC